MGILHKVTGIWLFTWISIDLCPSTPRCVEIFLCQPVIFYFISLFWCFSCSVVFRPLPLETSSSAFACLNEHTAMWPWSSFGFGVLLKGSSDGRHSTSHSSFSSDYPELQWQRDQARLNTLKASWIYCTVQDNSQKMRRNKSGLLRALIHSVVLWSWGLDLILFTEKLE